MSEIEHHRGIATMLAPGLSSALIEAERILLSKGDKLKKYYSNSIEQLCDEYYREFFYHEKTDILYYIKDKMIDPDDDIIKAKMREDLDIEYELRFYNGGAGFIDCLEEAMDKMYNKLYNK